MNEHEWVQASGRDYQFCRKCSVIRRADDTNKPCKGPARLRPFEPFDPRNLRNSEGK